MKISLYLLVSLLVAACVQAHGFVRILTVDGTRFIGNIPNGPHNPSTVRQTSGQDPVKGANNADINCGRRARPATDVANAKPGSKVAFNWMVTGANGLGKWPHSTGPMLTYMASCGNTTCDKFDSQDAKWFKIHEAGWDSNHLWHQNNTLYEGKPAEVPIPTNLAPGNYLIRHEIIALHIAREVGGAEFYPSCAQLKIGGSGTGHPAASDLVSLPGAYKDTDPGIFDKKGKAFNPSAKYVFPGPKIASFINADASGGDNTGDDDSDNKSSSSKTSKGNQTSSSSASEPSSTNKKSSGCKPKATVTVEARSIPSTVHLGRFSRVMRQHDLNVTFGRYRQHNQL